MDSDYSEDDIIPLNSPRTEKPEQAMIELPVIDTTEIHEQSGTTDLDKLKNLLDVEGALFMSERLHADVLESILKRMYGEQFPALIDKKIGQLHQLGLGKEDIIRIIISDELPRDPLKHSQIARQRAELGEAALMHLLEIHGLGPLAKQKINDVEFLLSQGKSFEFILTTVTK